MWGRHRVQHRRSSQDLVPKMQEERAAGLLSNCVPMCGHQGVDRFSRLQRIDQRSVHREMLQCVPLHQLRHEVRPGLAPFHLRTHLLRRLAKLRHEMVLAGEFQNGASDESAGAILPAKDDVSFRHVARQADDVGVGPPAALVVQQAISKQVGECGDASRAGTAGIEKHPIPWKERRRILKFNPGGNVDAIVAVQDEFVAVIHERLET